MAPLRKLDLPPRYDALAPLGRGGGGEVWAVRDRITGQVVALKVLAEGADEREVMALVREAVALSGVEGLGVPHVLRFGRLAGSSRPYMVRELVEGESLLDRIMRGGDARANLSAVAQAADQLARLHRALLLHGDIKPANIIVGEGGRATLVDLGLAAAWREGGAKPEGLTPKYAAPELLAGAPLTVRVEVYALGATLAEVVVAAEDDLEEPALTALGAVARRATAADPAERYPSAEELSSALRTAARLGAPEADPRAAWPIVGLDAPSAELLPQIAALRAGGGLVMTGPRLSGRSALLRRIAWSLGVEGRHVVWLEAEVPGSKAEALEIELGAYSDREGLIVLVDDADRLDDELLTRLDELRTQGARLVVSASVDGSRRALPGRTFEVFAMPRLPDDLAGDLVRRSIPSVSDAVVRHVVQLAKGWPGRIRALVEKLEGRPVVSPEDVDQLVGHETEGPPLSVPASKLPPEDPDTRAAIHRLLDRGHFEEAAEALDRLKDDTSPSIAIARARLYTNRGDTSRSLAELAAVQGAVESAADPLLAAEWNLHAARACLRAGDYPRAEQYALESGRRLEGTPPSDKHAAVVVESQAVCGLARSFASRHREAREVLDSAVSGARSLAEPRILSVALSSLAFALQRDDRLVEAKTAYEEGLDAAEEAGDAGTVATTRLNLAGIAKTQGDLARAIEHLEAAVDMGRRSGRIATLRQALLNLANLDMYLGRLAKARASLDQLASERAELSPQFAAQLLALEAESAARAGDMVTAAQLCSESAAAYDQMGRTVDAAEARIERVLFAVQTGGDAHALERELSEVAESLKDSTAHRSLLFLARGRVASLLGRDADAREALDKAIESARSEGQQDLVWRALDARAQLSADSGQSLAAKRDREEALGLLEGIASKLPRDLREVYWNDPRRRALRSAHVLDLSTGSTVSIQPVSQDRLARVLEINREIAGTYDLTRLMERVTDHAIVLLGAERGFVILKSRRASEGDVSTSSALSIHASRDQTGDDPHARFSQSIAERVIHSGEPVVTMSARDDSRMADYVSVHQLMLQSVACVPIRSRTAGTIGALYLETRLRAGHSFQEEVPTLMALADQVAIAIETARLVSENERRARELEATNAELEEARQKLEELLGHRTAQLAATRRDLRSARAVLRGHFGYRGLVGTSEAMRRVYALIDRVKDTDVPVLITGESGTGKEIVARAIHDAGPRAKKEFVGINCGAIPEHLLESELFGHVRGAFTGADRDRKGLFREATEGTILLDEIGEMPQKMQAGLLRVLQEKVVRPVGGAREEPVDTRVIAATHRDLETMVAAGSFREDLYYRLHVIQVHVPPLRQRLEDLPILIDHFLGIFAARYARERRSVSRAALKRLTGYGWPGNVRQLENVLLNAWVLSDHPELMPEDFELPDTLPRSSPMTHPPSHGAGETARDAASARDVETSLDAHRAAEKDRILHALAACNWNRVKAAEHIGMPRRTFYRRLKDYGIQ